AGRSPPRRRATGSAPWCRCAPARSPRRAARDPSSRRREPAPDGTGPPRLTPEPNGAAESAAVPALESRGPLEVKRVEPGQPKPLCPRAEAPILGGDGSGVPAADQRGDRVVARAVRIGEPGRPGTELGLDPLGGAADLVADARRIEHGEIRVRGRMTA